jgi:hypothetical protein
MAGMQTRVCAVCQQMIGPEQETVIVEGQEVHLLCAQKHKGNLIGTNPLYRE